MTIMDFGNAHEIINKNTFGVWPRLLSMFLQSFGKHLKTLTLKMATVIFAETLAELQQKAQLKSQNTYAIGVHNFC
jgi:hypothetical protein